ncbi:MAG: flavodoxin family protein [Candidatus Abyssobacteria bacterium SURF_17]|uniref:Flavodoxin family protein n=1 Tax=Candidatus Abyssobacteria bacterium SURF_17 TaxID=2093361 RepID=A0A419EZV6_9BACT|nr:MAG: flavodoxin family protein [Candidatus Abyssubacteria bacterium SURF_17]
MAKVLVVYFTRTGNTKAMAEIVAEAAEKEGAKVILKDVEETKPDEMLACDAIIAGSPTYYGGMAGKMKDFFDFSVAHHGKLAGKVGGAFSSSANIGGGNETTILDILHAMLIHGMIVEGTAEGDHYGPVSIDAPDDRVKAQCEALGRRVALLAKKLFS